MVPGPRCLDPADEHRATSRIQVVPGPRDQRPAARPRARGGVVVPGPVVLVPAGHHVPARVEPVGLPVDDQRRGHRVGAVVVAVPPAEEPLHPLARLGPGRGRVGRILGGRPRRLGGRIRSGRRSGVRGGRRSGRGGRIRGGRRSRRGAGGRIVPGHPVEQARVAAADGLEGDGRGLPVAEGDLGGGRGGGVDQHEARVGGRLLHREGDVLGGLGEGAVVGARVEQHRGELGGPGERVDDHEPLGDGGRLAEDLGGLGGFEALELVEVADHHVARLAAVDGAGVRDAHVHQAGALVRGHGLVTGGEVAVAVAAQDRILVAAVVLAGFEGDEGRVHGLRVLADVAHGAEDPRELVEGAGGRAVVVDDRGAVVAVVLHAEQAEPLLPGRQAQGGHDRLLRGGDVGVPVVVQVLAVQDRAGAVAGQALEGVLALGLPRLVVEQRGDDPVGPGTAGRGVVVGVPAEQVGFDGAHVVVEHLRPAPRVVVVLVGVDEGAGVGGLGPLEPLLVVVALRVVPLLLVAVLDVDQGAGVGLLRLAQEVMGLSGRGDPVLPEGGLGERPGGSLAQGLHHRGVEQGQVVEHGEGAAGEAALVGVEPAAPVALGGDPGGHHDAVLQGERLGAVDAPLAFARVEAGVAGVRGVVGPGGLGGAALGQAPHLDVVEAHGRGDVGGGLGLGPGVHPHADPVGQVVGVEIPVPQAARVAGERGVGDDGLPLAAVGLLDGDGDGVAPVPALGVAGQRRPAEAVDAVDVALPVEGELESGGGPVPLLGADQRVDGDGGVAVPVHQGAVVGLAAAVEGGRGGHQDVAAEVGVGLGDVDDVGGALPVLRDGRGDGVDPLGEVEVLHPPVAVGLGAVDGGLGARCGADPRGDGGRVVVAGGGVGVGARGELDGGAGLAVGQLVDDEVGDQGVGSAALEGLGDVGDLGPGLGAGSGLGRVGGDRVTVRVAGQQFDVGQGHVVLGGDQGGQAGEGDDGRGGPREGDVLLVVGLGQCSRGVGQFRAALPLAAPHGLLPRGEGVRVRSRVARIRLEGVDPVLGGQVVVAHRGVVGGPGGDPYAARPVLRVGVAHGEGVRE